MERRANPRQGDHPVALDPCQSIIDEIKQLNDDIVDVQAVLDRDFPPLTEKQQEEAKQQLQADKNKLAQRVAALLQCRQQNPEPPRSLPPQLDLDACKVAAEVFSVANVKCFGAIGKEVHSRGSISANSNHLKLAAPAQGETPLRTWVDGAGIAIASAGQDGLYPHVTRIATIVDDLNFILAVPAVQGVQDALITNDDSQPIQDAIRSFGDNGGTVYFPPGEYLCQGTIVLDDHSKIALVGPAARLGLDSGGATLIYPLATAPITQVEIASNVLTVTANNNFAIGAIVSFDGVATATFLNGQTVTTLTVSPTHFTANFTHAPPSGHPPPANYGPTADTGNASGSLIILNTSSNISFQCLAFQYSNPNYNGDLVKTGWSSQPADTSFLVWERCLFSGPPNVTAARSLLSLPRCIVSTIRECGFRYAKVGIWGEDGAYSNAISVQRCVFNSCDQWAILNPGQSWTINNCTFEPDSRGRASGIGTDHSGYSMGLVISDCWFGDASAEAPITQVAVALNVLTVTANNNFLIGTTVTFDSVVTAIFLNGQTVTILTVSPTDFTANFTHADYGPTADTGHAVGNTGKPWNKLFVIGASITGNYIARAGGPLDQAFIVTTGSQGVFFGGNRIEGGIGIEYPTRANEHAFGSAVIGNDFKTDVPIVGDGQVARLTVLANTNVANKTTHGLRIGFGEAEWSSDVAMNLGFISTLPQNLLVTGLAWMDGATRDADDKKTFVHGSLGLIAPSGQPAAEVVVLAGQKGDNQRPATAARFGYNGGFPYMKGAVIVETVGTVVASGAAMLPTGQIFHVSGAAIVSTITPPFEKFTGGTITLIPDDAFSWDTAGNIGRAGAAQVGLAVSFTYDGLKWWPNT
jgi:hypothetical protein